MNQNEIIEAAIQGHAGTRDAIRWAINQQRIKDAEICLQVKYDPCYKVRETFADAIRNQNEKTL